MGVPKFFRWLSERYPRINQRQTCLVNPETHERYYTNKNDNELKPPLISPDPMSTCGLPPQIDRLYIDCNGVIHGCAHNNGNATGVTQKEIFNNICFYLDRVISDMVKPNELVYIAIDGVAPRAKLNQQRARRYRGGSDEMEQTLYDDFSDLDKDDNDDEDDDDDDDDSAFDVNEVEIGLINQKNPIPSGKFESTDDHDSDAIDGAFHSNCITPGTEFFSECTNHLEHWLQYKLSTDPNWKHLTIILSGPNVPGEGEHKIMEFMRQERARPDYNPNLRHAIMGQDADLIMLGLATHEPNLCIFRERVIFNRKYRAAFAKLGLEVYLHNCHFEWLHMSVLRDYLMYEFETSPMLENSHFELERTIDDFVFLTFFVGNDFLPHMPALDIGDEAFDLIFYTYKAEREKWRKAASRGKKQSTTAPYLTERGEIVCGQRLEQFLQALGSYEVEYYNEKRQSESSEREMQRQLEARYGVESSIPSDKVLSSKEEADRAKYRDMIKSIDPLTTTVVSPVLTDKHLSTTTVVFQPEEERLEVGFLSRMESLLRNSITGEVKSDKTQESREAFGLTFDDVNDQDLKGRYYYDKFKFSPFDVDKHRALRKAYIEGLVWNLRYYYQGCASWSWFYPYHYGPMLSDLTDINELLKEVNFEGENVGQPLKPFEQLMGCMPPSSSYLLPEPYRWLMTDPNSPLATFYPRSFVIDMNGKRWPWEATVLLPFLDAKQVVQAANHHVMPNMLTDAEKARNQVKEPMLYRHDPKSESFVPSLPSAEENYFLAFYSTATPKTHIMSSSKSVFEAIILDGTETPAPGFPSLSSVPIGSLWRRRNGLNVHGTRSRYRTAVLMTSKSLPIMPSIEALASTLIGTTVFINYPYLTEAFVTSISNIDMTIRGHEAPYYHDENGRDVWYFTMTNLVKKLESGEGVPGTGGWRLRDSSATICVRPLLEIVTLEDGTMAKKFANFEVTLPLLSALWSPLTPDPRTKDLPLYLEPEPFFLENGSGSFTTNSSPTENGSSSIEGESLDPSLSTLSQPLIQDALSKQSLMSPTTSSGRMFSTTTPLVRRNDYRKIKNNTPLHEIPSKRSLHTMTTSFQQKNHHTIMTTRRHAFQGRSIRGVGVAALMVLGGILGGGGANAASHTTTGSSVAKSIQGQLLTTTGMELFPFHSTKTPPLEFEHGTTTLSFIFQHGIVVAVDSRATLGNFVGSKTVQKVLPIHSHMLGTMAGGAADCSFWIRKIKGEAHDFELKFGYRMSVTRASRLLANALYENRHSDLSIGTMIMGFDYDGGPQIYYVDNSGARIQGDLFSVGSGSTFALGVLDQERRFNMTEEEAIALGIKAIRHATFRDAYSGGFINVYLITSKGWKMVFSQDIASIPTSTSSPVDMVRRDILKIMDADDYEVGSGVSRAFE